MAEEDEEDDDDEVRGGLRGGGGGGGACGRGKEGSWGEAGEGGGLENSSKRSPPWFGAVSLVADIAATTA